MPAVANPKGFRLQTLDPTSPKGFKVLVPDRVAKALKPEVFREQIPDRVTLSLQSPPFTGELSEEQYGELRVLGVGERLVIATLRRKWSFVGFSVDPGDASGPPLQAELQVLVRGMKANMPGSLLTVTAAAGPVAQVPLIVAARAQLVVIGQTGEGAAPVHRVRGTIWGMSEQ